MATADATAADAAADAAAAAADAAAADAAADAADPAADPADPDAADPADPDAADAADPAAAAAAAHHRSEDHFLCSICLDVFTDPVSTPCGHTFCKECITGHWKTKLDCPRCKDGFPTEPQLKTNCLLSEKVHEFRHRGSNEPEDVLCDVCTGTKEKAMKSCLECLTSYCETHLEPHHRVQGLRGHHLIQPVENLEDRICPKHEKPLARFCKTDQTCVCSLCPVLDHEGHEFVPLKEEYEEKKVELKTTDAGVQQMIQERRVKVQEIRHSLMVSQKDADREKAEGVEVFTALKESVHRDLDQFLQEMEDKQAAAEKQAEDLITELEEEIFELLKRSSEVEQLSLSEDHFYLLQKLSALNAVLPTKNWTEVRVRPPLYKGAVVRAVEKMFSEQMKKLKKVELKKVQQFAVDLTLDPDTAHPNLILSEDRKQVHDGDEEKNLPENPERFSLYANVLGKESFSSGRFYFEVQVKGKTKWTLGVARESVNRKGKITLGPQNGFWTMVLRNRNEYLAADDPPVLVSVAFPPEKVGVFVDYDEGLVSFYDADAADLLYTFTNSAFTDKLHPFFSPCFDDGGINSAPLIICPVNQT